MWFDYKETATGEGMLQVFVNNSLHSLLDPGKKLHALLCWVRTPRDLSKTYKELVERGEIIPEQSEPTS